ncbi:hypothetical protein L1887_56240 [Cichorium endivia]|nr:hypothetical protein L1887_56240 [Cichorium endivia]
MVATRLLAGSATADTGEAGAVLARGGAVLLVASGSAVAAAVLAVATVTVAAGGAVGTVTATDGGARRAGGALVRGGHDLGGEVEELAQVLDTLVSEGVEVPLPRELRVHVAARGERLQRLDHLEVGDLELGVLNGEVLGGHHDTLLEERGVDGLAVLLADDHFGRVTARWRERWWEAGSANVLVVRDDGTTTDRAADSVELMWCYYAQLRMQRRYPLLPIVFQTLAVASRTLMTVFSVH